MLQHIGADDRGVRARRQVGQLDVALIDSAVVGPGMCRPQRVALHGVDDQPILLQHLPQESLRRAHVEHRRAANTPYKPEDLLVATLWAAVKRVVQSVVSSDAARRRVRWL